METQTASTIEDLARIAYECFELARRAGDERDDDKRYEYVRIIDGSPEWVTDLVREAHRVGSSLMLPDDWRYACVMSALEAIADGADEDDGAHDFADSYVDCYTSDLHSWLSSSGYRSGYVDDARDEGLTGPDDDLDRLLMAGQYLEAREVFESVYQYLSNRLDLETDDAPEELARFADPQDDGR